MDGVPLLPEPARDELPALPGGPRPAIPTSVATLCEGRTRHPHTTELRALSVELEEA